MGRTSLLEIPSPIHCNCGSREASGSVPRASHWLSLFSPSHFRLTHRMGRCFLPGGFSLPSCGRTTDLQVTMCHKIVLKFLGFEIFHIMFLPWVFGKCVGSKLQFPSKNVRISYLSLKASHEALKCYVCWDSGSHWWSLFHCCVKNPNRSIKSKRCPYHWCLRKLHL